MRLYRVRMSAQLFREMQVTSLINLKQVEGAFKTYILFTLYRIVRSPPIY